VRKAEVRRLELPPGRRVLVVSDIHGNLPFLKGVLAKAGFSGDDVLIILGDILERSEGSLDTLRYVMELSQSHTVYSILGNCDNIIPEFVRGRADIPADFYPRWFARLGERCTLVKMAHLAGVPIEDPADYPAARRAILEAFPQELAFLEGLPHILVNDDYLFVHGGVPREDRLEELDAFRVMKNDDFLSQGCSFTRWVVVGHWPVTLYHEHIPSDAPLLLPERKIASIDGSCVLKADGQLNALILPPEPGGEFSWIAWDGLPEVTALDPQEASAGSVNVRWGHNALELLEAGEEVSLCRHKETGRALPVLNRYLYESSGELFCRDSTDYRLPAAPGDRLSLVARTEAHGCLCKKDGVTGWYYGRLKD